MDNIKLVRLFGSIGLLASIIAMILAVIGNSITISLLGLAGVYVNYENIKAIDESIRIMKKKVK